MHGCGAAGLPTHLDPQLAPLAPPEEERGGAGTHDHADEQQDGDGAAHAHAADDGAVPQQAAAAGLQGGRRVAAAGGWRMRAGGGWAGAPCGRSSGPASQLLLPARGCPVCCGSCGWRCLTRSSPEASMRLIAAVGSRAGRWAGPGGTSSLAVGVRANEGHCALLVAFRIQTWKGGTGGSGSGGSGAPVRRLVAQRAVRWRRKWRTVVASLAQAPIRLFPRFLVSLSPLLTSALSTQAKQPRPLVHLRLAARRWPAGSCSGEACTRHASEAAGPTQPLSVSPNNLLTRVPRPHRWIPRRRASSGRCRPISR